MVAPITTTKITAADSFREETREEAEFKRINSKDLPLIPIIVSSDDESSSEDEMPREEPKDKPKKAVRRISFNESFNEEVEIPRISRKYKSRCWLTSEEIHHNMMMSKIRGMVHDKLVKLLAKNDDYFATADETEPTETETENESDDDFWPAGQEQEQKEREAEKKQKVQKAKKDRMLHHLLDAIMERQKEDIYSFLTNKCTISFTKKPKKKK